MRVLAPTLLLLLLAAWLPGQDPVPDPGADTITLANGDVIHGVIQELRPDEIDIDSLTFDEQTIDLADVVDIRAARLVEVWTLDGRRRLGRITGIRDGRLVFAEGRPISMDEIATPPVWKGAVSIGATLVTGNTERRGVNASADARRETDWDRIDLRAGWNYAREKLDGSDVFATTQQRADGRAKYDWKLSECDYVFLSEGLETDELADLDVRSITTLGYGRTIFDSDDVELRAEAGVAYLLERRTIGGDRDYAAGRAGYSLDWDVFGDDEVELHHEVEVTKGFQAREDLLVRGVTRVRTDLAYDLFAEARWEIDYDRSAPAGVDSTDNRFYLQVGWTF